MKGQQGSIVPYGQRYKLSPEQLSTILKEQYAAFMRVAGHVSIAHEWLEDIKDRCSHAIGSDPFTAADKVGSGIDKLTSIAISYAKCLTSAATDQSSSLG